MRVKLAVIVVGVVAVILVASFATLYFTTYNSIVAKNAGVDEKWAQVQQELQRRYDLIPNIVNACRGYMNYEGSVLQNVTELRTQWMTASQSGDWSAINNATAQMESGVSSLTVSVEAYPDLKSSDVVQSLMITLEGTENRISTERMYYNQAVRDYNTAIGMFPADLWASGWGFHTKPYFQAQIGSTEVPPVDM